MKHHPIYTQAIATAGRFFGTAQSPLSSRTFRAATEASGAERRRSVSAAGERGLRRNVTHDIGSRRDYAPRVPPAGRASAAKISARASLLGGKGAAASRSRRPGTVRTRIYGGAPRCSSKSTRRGIAKMVPSLKRYHPTRILFLHSGIPKHRMAAEYWWHHLVKTLFNYQSVRTLLSLLLVLSHTSRVCFLFSLCFSL